MNDITRQMTEIVVSAKPSKRGGIMTSAALYKGSTLMDAFLHPISKFEVNGKFHMKIVDRIMAWVPKGGVIKVVSEKFQITPGEVKDGAWVEIDMDKAPRETVEIAVKHLLGIQLVNTPYAKQIGDDDVRSTPLLLGKSARVLEDKAFSEVP